MVESIGICEKHELPLDANGDCELCRLSDMPSKAPPERSPWWALIIPLLILAAGAGKRSAKAIDAYLSAKRGGQKH